jgi:hypothetical protein
MNNYGVTSIDCSFWIMLWGMRMGIDIDKYNQQNNANRPGRYNGNALANI